MNFSEDFKINDANSMLGFVKNRKILGNTACSFGKIDVLGEKWLNFVLRVDLKVVNKAYSIYSLFESVSKVIG